MRLSSSTALVGVADRHRFDDDTLAVRLFGRFPDRWLGRVRMDPAGPIVAGSLGTYTYTFRVGLLGIDNGGTVKIAVRLASDWGRPQLDDPAGEGYTTVRTTGPARLRAFYDSRGHVRPFNHALVIEVSDEALGEGDEISVVWGDVSRGGPGAGPRRSSIPPSSSGRWSTVWDAAVSTAAQQPGRRGRRRPAGAPGGGRAVDLEGRGRGQWDPAGRGPLWQRGLGGAAPPELVVRPCSIEVGRAAGGCAGARPSGARTRWDRPMVGSAVRRGGDVLRRGRGVRRREMAATTRSR